MRGIELRLKRTERRVKVGDLAAAMGVTSSRVSHIESLAVVTPQASARYLAALSKFPLHEQAA